VIRFGFILFAIGIMSVLSCCSAGEGIPTTNDKAAISTSTPRADLYQCEGCEGALEADAQSLTWQTHMAAPDEPVR
jgi:hypothetical protein